MPNDFLEISINDLLGSKPAENKIVPGKINAPNSNLPPFDIKLNAGEDPLKKAKEITETSDFLAQSISDLGIENSKPATPSATPVVNINAYDPMKIFERIVPKAPKTKVKPPTVTPQESSGAMLALNKIWGLAKNPYDFVKGSAEFVASVPGFVEGLVSAAWEASEALGQGANLSDVYVAASRGMEETSANWHNAIVAPLGRLLDTPKTLGKLAAEKVTGVKSKEEEDYSSAVGDIAMAPLNMITKITQEVADAEWLKDYPNAKGAIQFGGDVLGLLTLGRIYKGGASEYAKDVEPIIMKADAINKQQKVIDNIPDEILKKAQEKVLEVEKNQLELDAKALQDKIDHEKVVTEDLKTKGKEVKDIKGGKRGLLEDPFGIKDELAIMDEKAKAEGKKQYEDMRAEKQKKRGEKKVYKKKNEELKNTETEMLEKSIEEVQPKEDVKPTKKAKTKKVAAEPITDVETYYHKTPSKNIDSILDEGFKARPIIDILDDTIIEVGADAKKRDDYINHLDENYSSKEPGEVYLAKDKDIANEYPTMEAKQAVLYAIRENTTDKKVISKIDKILLDIQRDAKNTGIIEVNIPKDISKGRDEVNLLPQDINKYKRSKIAESPQPITDVDLQTGTALPEELSTHNHPFRDKRVEHTNSMSKIFQERIGKTDTSPEVFTRYLINEVNRYLNGEEVNIEKVRNGLSDLAINADKARLIFENKEDFYAWKSIAQDAAQWARGADRLTNKRTGGTNLNMMIPINEAPKIVKDLLKNMRAGISKESFSLYRNKEVFDKTGFWLGKDGKWRYEIGPEEIKINLNNIPWSMDYRKSDSLYANLSDVIDSPKLFSAVPNIDKVKVLVTNTRKALGDYQSTDNLIRISSYQDRSTFTHELQHAINDIVGSKFRGSNVEVEQTKIFSNFLNELKNSAKSAELKREIENIEIAQNMGTTNKNIVKTVDNLIKTERLSTTDKEIISNIADKYLSKSAFENYLKDPGEMEARLASERMEMTAEQRKSEPPWETLDTLLDVEGFGDGYGTTGPVKAGLKLYSGIDVPEATKKIIAGAKALANYTAKARGMKEWNPKAAANMLKEGFTRSFVDRSGNIRKELLDKLGDDGYEIIQKMYLSKGASSLAAQQLKQMRKEVYDGLSKNEKRILDNLILADRMLDIGKYKTTSQFKFPEGLSPVESAAYNELFQFIEKITPEKAELLKQRAQAYFEWMKKPLKDMLDAELIDQAEYDALASHNYRRLKLVDVFDKRYQTKVGKTKRTVYDSGVDSLSRGRETDVFEPSSEVMALEVFNRAYGRILNNAANKTLLDLAREQKDNPFVAVKETPTDRVPSGWDRVFVYEKGERKALYLSPEISKEWITNNPEMSYKMSQFIRYASGSPILRTFATGIDWGFALANLPRDIMHIWYASRVFENGKWTPTYSTSMPVYFGQMGADIGGVFHDAILRKGKYLDYIKEGGGMEFLVHQGRLMQRGRHIEGGLDKVQDFLGYFGETSEIMTRLAVRDRVIKRRANEQGISYEEAYKDKKIRQEATFAARDYMDFGQGGGIGKALDNGLPYLNASIQGTRGMFRAFKDNPIQSTYKLSQFAALVTGLYIANQALNPETLKALKGDIAMQGNLIIPLGDGFGFDDEKGQRRYPYIKIPLDPGQKFFKMFFEASYDKATGQPVDAEGVANSLSQISPVAISSLPPTLSGTLGYMYNKDFWQNEDIWKKTDKPLGWPESKEEYIPGQTPQALIDVGSITGLSPERLKYTLSELVTGGSMWSWLVGQGYDAAFHDLPQNKKEMHLAEVLAKTPIAKRFIGITNPYTQYASSIEQAREESMLKRWVENRGLDQRVESYLYEGGKRSDVIDYIKTTSKDQATEDILKDRFIFQEKTKDLPNRSFWLSLKGTPDTDARAKLYVQRLESATPEEKEQLRKEEAIVNNAGGVISDEFKQAVMKYRYRK